MIRKLRTSFGFRKWREVKSVIFPYSFPVHTCFHFARTCHGIHNTVDKNRLSGQITCPYQLFLGEKDLTYRKHR